MDSHEKMLTELAKTDCYRCGVPNGVAKTVQVKSGEFAGKYVCEDKQGCKLRRKPLGK